MQDDRKKFVVLILSAIIFIGILGLWRYAGSGRRESFSDALGNNYITNMLGRGLYDLGSKLKVEQKDLQKIFAENTSTFNGLLNGTSTASSTIQSSNNINK